MPHAWSRSSQAIVSVHVTVMMSNTLRLSRAVSAAHHSRRGRGGGHRRGWRRCSRVRSHSDCRCSSRSLGWIRLAAPPTPYRIPCVPALLHCDVGPAVSHYHLSERPHVANAAPPVFACSIEKTNLDRHEFVASRVSLGIYATTHTAGGGERADGRSSEPAVACAGGGETRAQARPRTRAAVAVAVTLQCRRRAAAATSTWHVGVHHGRGPRALLDVMVKKFVPGQQTEVADATGLHFLDF